jgi:hypothetical protein
MNQLHWLATMGAQARLLSLTAHRKTITAVTVIKWDFDLSSAAPRRQMANHIDWEQSERKRALPAPSRKARRKVRRSDRANGGLAARLDHT